MTEAVEKELVTVSHTPAVMDSGSIMNVITNFASDPNFDVVKFEKLMDFQERMLNRSARDAFAADFVRMKPHLPKVIKSKQNLQTKSNYAPLEDINIAIDPILEKYGFATSTKIIAQTAGTVTVRGELWHTNGHVETNEITMPVDDKGIAGNPNKTLPHAISSSITYIKRIAISALLNISTGDDKDGNQIESNSIDEEKVTEIEKLLSQAKMDKNIFLKSRKVDSLNNIPLKDYDYIKKILSKRAEEEGKKANG